MSLTIASANNKNNKQMVISTRARAAVSSRLDALPQDVLFEIFKSLSLKDMVALNRLNRRWNELPPVWRRLFIIRYGAVVERLSNTISWKEGCRFGFIQAALDHATKIRFDAFVVESGEWRCSLPTRLPANGIRQVIEVRRAGSKPFQLDAGTPLTYQMQIDGNFLFVVAANDKIVQWNYKTREKIGEIDTLAALNDPRLAVFKANRNPELLLSPWRCFTVYSGHLVLGYDDGRESYWGGTPFHVEMIPYQQINTGSRCLDRPFYTFNKTNNRGSLTKAFLRSFTFDHNDRVSLVYAPYSNITAGGPGIPQDMRLTATTYNNLQFGIRIVKYTDKDKVERSILNIDMWYLTGVGGVVYTIPNALNPDTGKFKAGVFEQLIAVCKNPPRVSVRAGSKQ